MIGTKKVATNLPADLLKQATHLTGLNQTQAIVQGLRELVARAKRDMLLQLKGKVRVRLDVPRLRRRKRV